MYNHNFEGKYCYCDGTFDEGSDSMTQCIVCEDWFHDRCVSQPFNDDQDSFLICRNCFAKSTSLHPYLFSQDSRLENSGSCSRPVFNSLELSEAKEFFVSLSNLVQRLCRCASCTKLYSEENLDFILKMEELESKGSNVDVIYYDPTQEITGNEEIEDEFNLEKIALESVSKMPPNVQLDIAFGMRNFLESVLTGIVEKKKRKAEDGETNESQVITADDVHACVEEVRESLSRKRCREY